MTRPQNDPRLPWLEPGDAFPSVSEAWGAGSAAPGLLAIGGALNTSTLCTAYRHGIFPWYSDGQPPLWWSTDPRMVLRTSDFSPSHSLRKSLRNLLKHGRLEIRMDHDFTQVIHHCASTPRNGQSGTWIIHEMVRAYIDLHNAGHVHSVETWLDGRLVGGLYAVNMGKMVYGESMFSHESNASKMALCALVAFCIKHHMPLIDCQQETQHLASLGAMPMPRPVFLNEMKQLVDQTSPTWVFTHDCWGDILSIRHP